MEEALVAEGLTRRYGRVTAIEDVSFSLSKGEVLGFLGPNGAGKTTTIRAALGFIRPDAGRALVLGADSRDDRALSRVKSRIGFVPEDFSFPRGLRGKDVLGYLTALRGGSERIGEMLELFPVDIEKRVEEYSKGMKQMLAIILAFAHSPDLVVLDEPTTGLDPLMRERFLDFLKRESKRGAAVLMSSHVLGEVERVADRVCLIKNGRIVAIENLDALKEKAGKVVRARLRTPIDRRELEEVGGIARARIDRDGRDVELIVKGGYSSLLNVLAAHDVEDIEIRGISLEELFAYFYER